MSSLGTLSSLAADCHGVLRGTDARPPVSRVCTDSRSLQPGDLFVCLRGPTFDGHAFAQEAARRQAAGVLGEASALRHLDLPCPRILVDDSRLALGRLAAAHRRRFAIPVVAIAGSNGKTTTKELVATLLRRHFHTLASPASFNNDIGLPLTLLQLEAAHQVAVVEVGTNHPGELAPLLDIAQPTHGILTALGREHLEFFNDLAGVIQEEGTLGACLPPDGVLILPDHGPGLPEVLTRTRCRVIRTGTTLDAAWRLRSRQTGLTGSRLDVQAPLEQWNGDYSLRLLGAHQAGNALLALALGAELGLDRATLAAGLADARPARRRLELATAGGVLVLDDSYNANPDSMLAALAVLRELPATGRRLAVLGDMGELGPHAPAAHREIGAAAADAGIEALFAVGRWAGELLAGARSAGLTTGTAFPNAATAAPQVSAQTRPGDLVLVKASRATRLDVVADHLLLAAKHASEVGPARTAA